MDSGSYERATDPPREREPTPQQDAPPAEIGGWGAPDPTRYGDWERAGRCMDF